MIAISILLLSCNKNEKSLKVSENVEKISSKDSMSHDLIQDTLSTNRGKTINIIFNTSSNTASIFYDGEYIQLKAQKTASGFHYKGEGYELLGKEDALELKKDNVTVAKR